MIHCNTVLKIQNNLAFLFCAKQFWDQTINNSREYLLLEDKTVLTTQLTHQHLPQNIILCHQSKISIPQTQPNSNQFLPCKTCLKITQNYKYPSLTSPF